MQFYLKVVKNTMTCHILVSELVSFRAVFVLRTDEFNRVIIPVKRGEENTDYVNASFIDVSVLKGLVL